jgi:hypothetical protein
MLRTRELLSYREKEMKVTQDLVFGLTGQTNYTQTMPELELQRCGYSETAG